VKIAFIIAQKEIMYICRTRRESLGSENGFFFGIYCLSQQRNREYDPEGFLCMRARVCVHVWVSCRHYAKRAFLMAVYSLTFQDDRRTIWPVFWS